jgi:hypothetical protein
MGMQRARGVGYCVVVVHYFVRLIRCCRSLKRRVVGVLQPLPPVAEATENQPVGQPVDCEVDERAMTNDGPSRCRSVASACFRLVPRNSVRRRGEESVIYFNDF